MSPIHIDGDFLTGIGTCQFHCSPTCHPGQIDENEWHYGCLHKAWPANKEGDFCPFVKCDGDLSKCEIPQKLIGNMVRGLRVRIKNTSKKLEALKDQYTDLEKYGKRDEV